ncbi:G patch domain-containing protein 8 [Psilocybe cubensis]|uniref:G-patch domain-containing protein n=2 Tax=Psilocybe cubensis TaxID=181762 RepID=A0A8H7Y6H5_PSICU|nr:G patch domain-containing protein 8 [Psilocybe cubensis]KAH9487145.1 G patch domain-containing protein 8 [Psilocybe cubensis]
MSSSTIARWNAIPLERPRDADSGSTSLKRGRPEDDGAPDADDDDDDVSLVSRSPSPVPQDAMDVDDSHLHKYDEYIRGPAREVITVETKIKPTNKGFALLSKFGWVEGQPVGLSGEGRTEPIPFHIKSDLTGLGKTSQDVRMIEETVSQRRELDSERQQKESEEQRKLREDSVARKTALESEISSTLRPFYCTLCDKQFKNVAQYDEHTNSYAHHHKARFKDMQASARLKPKEEVDKRKEKERKREEKELRKIAAANGIKMPKPAATPAAMALVAQPSPSAGPNATANNMDIDGIPISTDSKRSNWASFSGDSHQGSSQGSAGGSNGGFSKSGWATVGGPSSNSSTAASSRFGPPTESHLFGLSVSQPAGEQTSTRSGHNPTFRNAGWTSLDTGNSQSQPPRPPPPPAPTSNWHPQDHAPPPPPPPAEAPPPPPELGQPTGFSSSSSAQQWQKSSFAPVSSSTYAPPPPPQPPAPPNSFASPPPPPPPSASSAPPPPPPPSHSVPPAAPSEPKPVRSSWQQFQKGRRK